MGSLRQWGLPEPALRLVRAFLNVPALDPETERLAASHEVLRLETTAADLVRRAHPGSSAGESRCPRRLAGSHWALVRDVPDFATCIVPGRDGLTWLVGEMSGGCLYNAVKVCGPGEVSSWYLAPDSYAASERRLTLLEPPAEHKRAFEAFHGRPWAFPDCFPQCSPQS